MPISYWLSHGNHKSISTIPLLGLPSHLTNGRWWDNNFCQRLVFALLRRYYYLYLGTSSPSSAQLHRMTEGQSKLSFINHPLLSPPLPAKCIRLRQASMADSHTVRFRKRAPSEKEWLRIKDHFYRLYIEQDLSLSQTSEILAREQDFHAG